MARMDSAWLSMTADDLLRQAEVCKRLAAHVHNRELSTRLEAEANQLMVEARRKATCLNGKPKTG